MKFQPGDGVKITECFSHKGEEGILIKGHCHGPNGCNYHVKMITGRNKDKICCASSIEGAEDFRLI